MEAAVDGVLAENGDLLYVDHGGMRKRMGKERPETDGLFICRGSGFAEDFRGSLMFECVVGLRRFLLTATSKGYPRSDFRLGVTK